MLLMAKYLGGLAILFLGFLFLRTILIGFLKNCLRDKKADNKDNNSSTSIFDFDWVNELINSKKIESGWLFFFLLFVIASTQEDYNTWLCYFKGIHSTKVHYEQERKYDYEWKESIMPYMLFTHDDPKIENTIDLLNDLLGEDDDFYYDIEEFTFKETAFFYGYKTNEFQAVGYVYYGVIAFFECLILSLSRFLFICLPVYILVSLFGVNSPPSLPRSHKFSKA
jgi:hypothetical protein